MIRPLPPGWTRPESAHDRLVREGKVTAETITLDDIAAEDTDESNARRLAWFTDEELAAELQRRALGDSRG